MKLPNTESIRKHLVATRNHACFVELIAQELGISPNATPDRPHDLVEIGNPNGDCSKLAWDVIRGLSQGYEYNGELIYQYAIKDAMALHRNQHHHKMWNHPNHTATDTDMKIGAIDTLCTWIENRPYNMPIFNWEQVAKRIEGQDDFHKCYLEQVAEEVEALGIKRIKLPDDLSVFPDIGLKDSTYETIQSLFNQCLRTLRQKQGYITLIS